MNSKSVALKTKLEEIESKITKFKKERCKKGNLVSVGEVRLQDYYNSTNGLFPNKIKLSASSEVRHYFTNKVGTLLFLFDGICENEVSNGDMFWEPTATDESPWLKISFPEKKIVNKIILYPVKKAMRFGIERRNNPNSAGGFVQVKKGNKYVTMVEFNSRNSDVIKLSFPAISSDELLIKFNSNTIALSEVEVYNQPNKRNTDNK